MKVIIVKNYEDMSEKGANIIKNVMIENPKAVLGLATGSTPVGIYKFLIKFYKNKEISFKFVKTVNLDEYIGLDENHDQSYKYFMNDNLFSHVDIDMKNVNFPDGTAQNMEKECEKYTELLKNTVQDVQLLGIGANGHIGFNEPGTDFLSTTHTVDLKEQTIKDNARFFDDISLVPKRAVTMGIADIMRAKSVVLVAFGQNKAKAVFDMIKGKPDIACPASVLQNHPNCTVIIDESAAELIKN